MPPRVLTALPVYNEVAHVDDVLAEVLRYSPEVLVIDDGSNDGTAEVVERESGGRARVLRRSLGMEGEST